MTQRQLRWATWLVITAMTGGLACGGGTEPDRGPQPVALKIKTDLGVGYVLQETIPQPIVMLVGADSLPIRKAGVVVTVTVPDGDAKVVAGGTATTNADGEAHFAGLMFGALAANSGSFEVRYNSPGLSGASEFEAITCRLGVVPRGTTVSADLRDGDCLAGGARYRYYDEPDNAPLPNRALRITQTAASFEPAVYVQKRYDSYRGFFGFGAQQSDMLSFKALAPVGQPIRFMASSAAANKFGAFDLHVSIVPDHEPGCEPIIIFTPVSSAQALESACTDDEGNVGDVFTFMLMPNQRIDATVTSSAFTPYVSVWSYEPNVRLALTQGTNSSATVAHTNNTGTPRFYYVFVGSSTGSGVGAYNFGVGVSPFVALRSPTTDQPPPVFRGPLRARGGGRGTLREARP